MKKLFTFYVLIAALLFANGQQLSTPHSIEKSAITKGHSPLKFAGSTPSTKNPHSVNRAASQSIVIDYPGADAYYADQIGTDFYYIGDIQVNRRYKNLDVGTYGWGAAVYDSLIYLDANNNDIPTFLPRALTSLTLDSLDVFFIHEHAPSNTSTDSIIITVYDRTGLTLSANNINATKLWDTIIQTTSQIPFNVSNGGTPAFTAATVYPNITMAQGKTFIVKVDFAGDTANKFNLLAGFRDDCLNDCAASESSVNSATGLPNSLYYINADLGGGNNLSGINSVQSSCPQNPSSTCNQWYPQNWWIYPSVTATSQYGAAISADSLKGCPGTILNLNAITVGSTATPFTYSWAATGTSTLTSTSDQQVSLVVGNSGNSTVTVTVTDATNATTTATVTVTNSAINISFTNANPLTLNCGSSANLITTVSGVTSGAKTYAWSTGANGVNVSTQQINTPGTYRVTVTNTAGCSASASISVQYPNVTNTVSFTNPAPPVCEDRPVTFTNTSTGQNGWTAQWTFGDGNVGFTNNGTNTYSNPGVYTVKLQMDSAGCSFVSNNVSLTVLAASNPACTTGFEDASFSNNVTLLPNPSNGNVNVTVNGVEKNVSIRVYNVIGSEVKFYNISDVASAFNKSFDFSDLANGTYLVKVQSADKTAVKRLTISK